jgi:GDP-L-fucose synthase
VFLANLSDDVYGKLINNDEPPLINVGSGKEVTIRELAHIVSSVLGFDGRLAFDSTKPDGTPRKLMDSSKINKLGWHAKVSLEDGIKIAYNAAKESGLFQA